MTIRARATGTLAPLLLAALTSCGGGSSTGGSTGDPAPNAWIAGVFQPESTFAAKCASPRSGASAVTGHPFPDVQGTALDERNWLRSWTHDLYLWYREVPDLNPAGAAVTLDYFDQLKTQATTASGQPKDKFHFTYPTAVWEQLSQTGAEAGYGFQWELLSSRPPRKVAVAYIEPAAPAGSLPASLIRGSEVTRVDGVDIDATVSSQIDTLNAGLFPANAGERHTFGFRNADGATFQATLTSANLTSASVMNVKTLDTGSGIVGYIQFNNQRVARRQRAGDRDRLDDLRQAVWVLSAG